MLAYHLAKGTFKRPIPSYRFLGAQALNTDLTTYTFTGVYIGRPDPSRIICLACHAEDAATTFTLVSGTIDGIACTLKVTGAPAEVVVSGFLNAQVPMKENVNITVTWSEAVTSCAIGVYALYDFVPYSMGWHSQSEATGTGAMNVENNQVPEVYGVTIGASSNVGGETAAWSTVTAGQNGFLTEHYDNDSAELGYSGASLWLPNHGLSPGLSVDWSGTGAGDLVGMSFYSRYHRAPRLT